MRILSAISASMAILAALAASAQDAQDPAAEAAEARFLQGRDLAAAARFEDAVVVFDAFLESAPDSPRAFEAMMLRGEALVSASALTPHFQEAAISFSLALESENLTPQHRARAAAALMDALLRTGNFKRTSEIYARLKTGERLLLLSHARENSMRRVIRFIERMNLENG